MQAETGVFNLQGQSLLAIEELVALSVEDEKIVLRLQPDVSWLSMTPTQARWLSYALLSKATVAES